MPTLKTYTAAISAVLLLVCGRAPAWAHSITLSGYVSALMFISDVNSGRFVSEYRTTVQGFDSLNPRRHVHGNRGFCKNAVEKQDVYNPCNRSAVPDGNIRHTGIGTNGLTAGIKCRR